MDFLKNIFNIKDDAQPVDVITSGKDLRTRQEELGQATGGITEELMKQNPDLFNQITSPFSKPLIANKFTIGDLFTAKSALQGSPFGMFGLGMLALRNLPKETPEQKTVKGLYDLDSIGRVQSGIMQGYNPVSLFGPTGLSGAMIDRITKINETLNNPKISQAVKDRLDARKAELQAKIAAEQAAMRRTIEQQYINRPGEYGGPDRQTEREQAGPGYDDVSEAGSFRYGGIASL